MSLQTVIIGIMTVIISVGLGFIVPFLISYFIEKRKTKKQLIHANKLQLLSIEERQKEMKMGIKSINGKEVQNYGDITSYRQYDKLRRIEARNRKFENGESGTNKQPIVSPRRNVEDVPTTVNNQDNGNARSNIQKNSFSITEEF